MLSTPWRERLTYTAMSALVAWHTFAMVVAPAPEGSVTVQTLRVPLQPYLTLFMLDNKWQFFAPDINRGTQLRYVVEDNAGKLHAFMPREELNWLYPNFIWFDQWYQEILDYPAYYGASAAAFFCEKHASLRPVAVTIQEVDQQDFSAEDWLAGKHPLDPEFVNVSTLTHVPCPS